MRQTDYDNRDLKQMNPKMTRLYRLLNLGTATFAGETFYLI